MMAKLILLLAHLFLLGALLIGISQQVHHYDRKQRRDEWIKYLVYLSLVTLIMATAYAGRALISTFLIMVALLSALELYRCLRFRFGVRLLLASSAFLLLAACLLHIVMIGQQIWLPAFCFVFLIVCATDSFSQIWGRLLGRHRLTKISPGKTWEGLIGGLITAVSCAAAFSFLLRDLSLVEVLILGFAIEIAAVAGDLLFSLIKRRIGIKEYSDFLPGHGGLLDRFDSLIVAGPVFYWIHRIVAP